MKDKVNHHQRSFVQFVKRVLAQAVTDCFKFDYEHEVGFRIWKLIWYPVDRWIEGHGEIGGIHTRILLIWITIVPHVNFSLICVHNDSEWRIAGSDWIRSVILIVDRQVMQTFHFRFGRRTKFGLVENKVCNQRTSHQNLLENTETAVRSLFVNLVLVRLVWSEPNLVWSGNPKPNLVWQKWTRIGLGLSQKLKVWFCRCIIHRKQHLRSSSNQKWFSERDFVWAQPKVKSSRFCRARNQRNQLDTSFFFGLRPKFCYLRILH